MKTLFPGSVVPSWQVRLTRTLILSLPFQNSSSSSPSWVPLLELSSSSCWSHWSSRQGMGVGRPCWIRCLPKHSHGWGGGNKGGLSPTTEWFSLFKLLSFFLKDLRLLFLCMYKFVFYANIYLRMFVEVHVSTGAQGIRKRVSDPLELEW